MSITATMNGQLNKYLPGKSLLSGKKLATNFKQRVDKGQNLVVCLVFKEVRLIYSCIT